MLAVALAKMTSSLQTSLITVASRVPQKGGTMALYVLTYDERASHQHDYGRLYELLDLWKAAHLQNSVWLVDRSGTAAQVRDAMKTHMHTDDSVLRRHAERMAVMV
jgi:hypothetical protein